MSRMGLAMRELGGRQRSARGVSYYSRLVNRPAGRVLAAAFSLTRITANQVSLLSAAVTGLGLAVLVALPPSPAVGVAVWALLALGFMIDSADGQLARLRGGGSPLGEWLDHVLDAAKTTAVHAAVLLSWHRHVDLPDDRLLLVPLGYQLIAVTMFAAGVLADLLRRGHSPDTAPGTPSRARSLALLVADYGMFCALFLLLGWPMLFVTAYTAAALLNAAALAALATRWWRMLRSL